MDTAATRKFVDGVWDESIVPDLIEYIKIPNKSPAFDADWHLAGRSCLSHAVTPLWGPC